MRAEVRPALCYTFGAETADDVEVLFVYYESEDGKQRHANLERMTRDELRDLRNRIDEFLSESEPPSYAPDKDLIGYIEKRQNVT